MVIYKYPLSVTDRQSVIMPLGASCLSVQEQNGKLCLWAIVETDQKMMPRTIHIFGTGNPITRVDLDDLVYLGTVQMSNGLVWHVFWEL